MDELTFSARRAREGSHQRGDSPDIETRFKTLVQSPLRAGIIRFLSARPGESFDNEAIMQAFGRMRLDVDNCVHELVEFGVVQKNAGDTPTYTAVRPGLRTSRNCSRSSSRDAPISASRNPRHRYSAFAK